MTLYNLANSITIQGDIKIIRLNDAEDTGIWTIYNTSDLSYNLHWLDNFEGVEDLQVTYIYSITEENKVWTVIEVCEEEEITETSTRGDYEVSVLGLETYWVMDANSEEEAIDKAIDLFRDDDLYYDTEEAENVTEKDCRVVDFVAY